MESSKATAKHILTSSRGPTSSPGTINMHHQRTQLPTRNYPRRKSNSTSGQKPQNCKTHKAPMTRKAPDMLRPDTCSDKCNRCSNTPHAKGFQCPARKFQCEICLINLATSHQYVSRKAKVNTLLIPFMQGN